MIIIISQKMCNVNGTVPLRAVTTCRSERACNIAVPPRPKTISGRHTTPCGAATILAPCCVHATAIYKEILNADIFMAKAAPIHSSPDEIIQPTFQITHLLCWGYYIVHRTAEVRHCLIFTTGRPEKGAGKLRPSI